MGRFIVILSAFIVTTLPIYSDAVQGDREFLSVSASTGTAARLGQESASRMAKHGEYLVHHVAMCVYCHSPRQADGTLDRQQLLSGGVIPMDSPSPQRPWAFRAPGLIGLPGGWSDDQVVHLLRTGETPTGRQLRLPMPPFRMNEEDARSVAAYLRSLQK
jgi:mono/diheme cytochrome c family protein